MDQLTLIEPSELEQRAKGKIFVLQSNHQGFRLQFEHPNGRLYQGNSIDWLKSLDDASVDLVFADPPYNIRKAEWDSFDSQEEYIDWSIQWISQVSRVLKPAGSLYAVSYTHLDVYKRQHILLHDHSADDPDGDPLSRTDHQTSHLRRIAEVHVGERDA